MSGDDAVVENGEKAKAVLIGRSDGEGEGRFGNEYFGFAEVGSFSRLGNAIDGEGQHLNTFRRELGIVRFESGELLAAVGTPAGPEVNENGFSFSAGVRFISLDLSIEVDVVERRCRCAVSQDGACLFGGRIGNGRRFREVDL